MTHSILALLALVAPFPALPGQDIAAQETLCQRLAGELESVGVPVDLSKLTIEVLPKAEFAKDLADLESLFRPQGFYEAQYQVRQAFDQNPGADVETMKAALLKRRISVEPVHYHFGRDALVFLKDEPLALRDGLVAAALTVAWRDQVSDLGAAMELEERRQEVTLVRAAMIYGEAEAAVRRLLDARGSEVEQLSDHEVELALRARGLDAFRERIRSEGRRFCERRLRESGGQDAMTHYWSALPSSTEQLLHERKWKADAPGLVALPEWPEEIENTTLVHVDTIGELGIFGVLVQAGVKRNKAFEVSVGWDGDVMHLYRMNDEKDVLVWRTVWDRQRDAEQFARIWRGRTRGEVRVGGRAVDWVFASAEGPWETLLTKLTNNTPKVDSAHKDATSTSEIEEEFQRNRALAAYVTGNLWRHPKYDLTLPVPIGWYEDRESGVPFIARTGSGSGFTDAVRVGSRANRLKRTVQQVLAQNLAAVEAQEERSPILFEVREIDGQEVAYMRFEGHDGTHDVIYTTVIFLSGGRQVAITISIEEVRWEKVRLVIDECIAGIKFQPVERMAR